MSESVVVRSFAAGELSPSLAARADLAKYAIGLRRCRNFVVQRHGGAATRPGLRFIEACKTTSSNVTLRRYVSEIDGESVLVEVGASYLRFFQNGARVEIDPGTVNPYSGAQQYLQGDLVKVGTQVFYAVQDSIGASTGDPNFWYTLPGNVYEIPTPFPSVAALGWAQSGRVITLTHPSVAPQDLVFSSLTRWVLVPVSTRPKIDPPVGLVLSGTGAGARSFGYVVTAAAPGTYEESEASTQVIAAGAAEPTPDTPHALTWTPTLTPPLTGEASPEYYVYCDPYGNGTYGFLGTATGAASFKNPGLTPDFAVTPPLPRELFTAVDQFPAVAAYHQQRRFFARTNDVPDGVWASRVGFPDNFGISSPLQDDDALTFKIAGNNHHHVRHLVALRELILLTGGGAWPLRPEGGVLTPNTLNFDQETYAGCSSVPPVVIGNAILYVQARGSILRDLRFEQQVEGLNGRDLTLLAGHLFDGFTILSIDYAEVPHSIVWACRSDGTLLGLTYIAEQDVWGWHRHDTGAAGRFEAVCVIPEIGEDAAYVIVRRTIGGAIVRYIEKLEKRTILDWNRDAFCVDSGLSYDGTPVTSVSGLDHLEGQTVTLVGDGRPLGTRVVAGGAVALGASASVVHAGLPMTPEIESLTLDVAGSAIRDKKKRVGSVTLVVDQSARGFHVGPDAAHLTPYRPAPHDPTDVAFSGDIELNITSRFNEHGRVFIRQVEPLPMTVLALIPNVEVGG